ncbi:MAG: hypothetical protein WD992_03020 [Candidatus Levyibacteriota bacterium]
MHPREALKLILGHLTWRSLLKFVLAEVIVLVATAADMWLMFRTKNPYVFTVFLGLMFALGGGWLARVNHRGVVSIGEEDWSSKPLLIVVVIAGVLIALIPLWP